MNSDRPSQPFPGLRPFEQHESSLFFGRDEQCDELLSRLARRRLVAVVGTSGSGKSSLVRAGLLPSLDRGYVPSAGSSWHVAIFRPGSAPLANLNQALVERRRPSQANGNESSDAIRAQLESSSLGLIGAARTLLTDAADSLLVVADQFEEIFRFGRLSAGHGLDEAAACVDLLINASQQTDLPVYVVITMRSDYLGDCAQFTGLPEALNDSQFLVPRMTRAQLRAAIENPVAVCGARITPGLVQRLLYDVEQLATDGAARSAEYDQLPLLQHALMRVWQVSRTDREHGRPIDLPHYEQAPVETLAHALDHHAEEIYHALPSDTHREIARKSLQQLTDRDPENREVRRPTPLPELAAVALRSEDGRDGGNKDAVVHEVVAAFSAPDCAFLVTNAQHDVDISHESFIRKWNRLRQWVDEEAQSRRIYTKLVDAAVSRERREGSLFRGPELAETRRWWVKEKPTQLWSNRYDTRFSSAQRFLTQSVRAQRLRRAALAGNVLLIMLFAAAIVRLLITSRNDALSARNAIDSSRAELRRSNQFYEQAIQAAMAGKDSLAQALTSRAQTSQQQASAPQVLTGSELAELQRLKREESVWKRDAEAWKRTADELSAALSENARMQNSTGRYEQAINALKQSEDSLKKTISALQAQLATVGLITQVLRDYEIAYESLDAAGVVRVMPSVDANRLSSSFSQYASYQLDIGSPRIRFEAGEAVVRAIRRIQIRFRVGSSPEPQEIDTTFRLYQRSGRWIIGSVQ
jgi:energy-coupling factor transporter ATP-binding protein EcfA2